MNVIIPLVMLHVIRFRIQLANHRRRITRVRFHRFHCSFTIVPRLWQVQLRTYFLYIRHTDGQAVFNSFHDNTHDRLTLNGNHKRFQYVSLFTNIYKFSNSFSRWQLITLRSRVFRMMKKRDRKGLQV